MVDTYTVNLDNQSGNDVHFVSVRVLADKKAGPGERAVVEIRNEYFAIIGMSSAGSGVSVSSGDARPVVLGSRNDLGAVIAGTTVKTVSHGDGFGFSQDPQTSSGDVGAFVLETDDNFRYVDAKEIYRLFVPEPNQTYQIKPVFYLTTGNFPVETASDREKLPRNNVLALDLGHGTLDGVKNAVFNEHGHLVLAP
ncbi:hypothetical protein LX32DRAFT_679585 [Colletotrichum zoysiae]|uniref:Uncharacterized protein n=1 Tax=Colletotrichum zoysiae TaxID=1216348 RepID=A0AAD9M407_9PEZI|nr:hypothetical protein LX32DRAFT_679585 [Colletotrichum zoysiae]